MLLLDAPGAPLALVQASDSASERDHPRGEDR